MSDLISRDAVIGALEDRRDKYQKDSQTWLQIQLDILAIRATPAADAPEAIGILQARMEDQATEIARLTRIIQMQPPRIPAADARAEALKEAANRVSELMLPASTQRQSAKDYNTGLGVAYDAIHALIGGAE